MVLQKTRQGCGKLSSGPDTGNRDLRRLRSDVQQTQGLKPALTQLDDLERALQRENPAMLEVNRAIAQAAEQSHNISKLQAAGLLDTDACAAKLNAINIQLTQLRRERRRLLEHDDIEDTIGRLHQTADAIKAGPERLDTFDEDLFEELVEEVVAESQTRIRFRLHGGIELAEKVGRAKR